MRSLALLAALQLGANTLAHAAPCPLNEFSLTQDVVTTTDAAAIDTVEADLRIPGNPQIIFNLASGFLQLYTDGTGFATFVRVRDSYDLAGVAPGTPATITAELSVSGVVATANSCGPTCGVTFVATIRSGVESQRYQATFGETVNNGTSPFSGVVRLVVPFAAGQPRVVEFELWAQVGFGGHPILGQAEIGFTGLPPGAAIVSCQGFGGTQVPVHRTSWGEVKTIYR